MSASVIIEGGPIFRGLHEGFAEALAVRGDRIAAVGTRASVAALAGPDARRIDLGGRCAIPAFNDAHLHLLPLGLAMIRANLRAEAAPTLDALLASLRRAAAEAAPGDWVLGGGYDHAALDVARHPTRAELDAAIPDRPVFITRACGHMGVANSAALALAGITEATPDPPGGVIGREGGILTGLVQERAMRLVEQAIPEPSDAALVGAIERAGRHLNALGIASVMEAALGMTAGMRELDAYRAAHAAGRLPVRTWLCVYGDPGGIAERAWQAGARPGEGDDMLRFGAMKLFTDGSAGGLTAAFSEPYRQGGRGVLCFPDEVVRERLALWHRQGWQLAIHAIGDAAIEQVLSAMEAADTAESPVAGRRHRIEHCGFATAPQRARMAARGIVPVPQPVFMRDFGGLYVTNLGEPRGATAYPMRTWLAEGANPAASTDAPVCQPDPFANLHVMLTRRTAHGAILGPDERIGMAEAIHAYTECGAWTQFAEDRKGRLLPGMLADIAILSRDVFSAGPDAILETHCDLLLRGGEVVFER
jgi:predicted amidohydrolase YtcJ